MHDSKPYVGMYRCNMGPIRANRRKRESKKLGKLLRDIVEEGPLDTVRQSYTNLVTEPVVRQYQQVADNTWTPPAYYTAPVFLEYRLTISWFMENCTGTGLVLCKIVLSVVIQH